MLCRVSVDIEREPSARVTQARDAGRRGYRADPGPVGCLRRTAVFVQVRAIVVCI